jgi:hypothetical protein
MKLTKAIIPAFCICMSLSAQKYQVDTFKINSSVLNEERIIIIYSQKDLLINDTFCMIYMLDGELSDYRLHSISEEKLNTL